MRWGERGCAEARPQEKENKNEKNWPQVDVEMGAVGVAVVDRAGKAMGCGVVDVCESRGNKPERRS